VRVVRISRCFFREVARLAPLGSAAGSSVSRVLRELSDEHVPAPGPEDVNVDLPPQVMGRRVSGTDLLVAYVPLAGEVDVVSLCKGVV
jgi:hypothetical protein